MGSGPDALRAAIDEAWRVFDIPAPATTGVCVGCCMDPEIEADFLKRPARDLPAVYVQEWYKGGYHVNISHDHVAWFLPRVMELLAEGTDVVLVGQEATLSRLPLAGFPHRWRSDEVALVQRFAKAFFAALLADEIPNADPDIDSWLCMFGIGGVDVGPLLAQMDVLSDSPLIDILHRGWVYPDAREIPADPFWEPGTARQQVWEWYTSDALLARMGRAARAGSEKALDLYDLIVASQANAPH